MRMSVATSTVGAMVLLVACGCAQHHEPIKTFASDTGATRVFLSGYAVGVAGGGTIALNFRSAVAPGVRVPLDAPLTVPAPGAVLRFDVITPDPNGTDRTISLWVGSNDDPTLPLGSVTFRNTAGVAAAALAHGWIFGSDAWIQIETDNVVVDSWFFQGAAFAPDGAVGLHVGGTADPHLALRISGISGKPMRPKAGASVVTVPAGSFVSGTSPAGPLTAPTSISTDPRASGVRGKMLAAGALLPPPP